ncbi:MAG TPA: flagellar export protein FliJ [Rhodocyclaceae bacterium]|nr:flagellar export protein FliJ [Rhodocyclaceae bacterium]
MAKQTPIEMLLELAQGRVDEATKRLGALLTSEHACEVKLDMLIQYRKEYRERFMQAARDGIGPDAWRNYSVFIGKLDDAIVQQQQIVDNSKQLTSQGQKQWVSERNRMKAFDTLSARKLAADHRRLNKDEQRQNDEHAAKQHREKGES